MSDKRRAFSLIRAVAIGVVLGGIVLAYRMQSSKQSRIGEIRKRINPSLSKKLEVEGFVLGNPAFIRIFKEESDFEIWMRPPSSTAYQLFRTYKIAKYSGTLGPKLKEGDRQAPEGFYSVTKQSLNPNSDYHLAFNIGYPNYYDQIHHRTGNLIMVHGSNVSIGCFAMTDPVIEEIYLIVEAALNQGQERVFVHVFPFRMTDERMAKAWEARQVWFDFWENLKEGYEIFGRNNIPPDDIYPSRGRYAFGYTS